MKIYTKTGDEGQTSLIGGTRVPKNNPKIEAYGTIDELNSFVGLLSTYPQAQSEIEFLRNIQHKLFNIGSNLATDTSKTSMHNASIITEEDILEMETQIDKLDVGLPELSNFVLPGGSAAGSVAHVCRTVTRRAERRVLDLMNQEQVIDPTVLKYINRMSDYFFTLSRHITVNECNKEIFWKK